MKDFLSRVAGCLMVALGCTNASSADTWDYSRIGGNADWLCCNDQACTSVIGWYASDVRAAKECGKLTVADGLERYVSSAKFRVFRVTETTTPPVPIAGPVLSGVRVDNTTDATRSNVTLSWTAIAGASSYQLERCSGIDCTNFTVLANVTVLAYANTNLPSNFTFSYRVRAILTTEQGTYSNVWTIVIPAASLPVIGTVTLSWIPPTHYTDGSTLLDLIGYRIEYSEIFPLSAGPTFDKFLGLVISPSITSYVISDLMPGTWAFRLRAVTQQAVGETSNVVTKIVQ